MQKVSSLLALILGYACLGFCRVCSQAGFNFPLALGAAYTITAANVQASAYADIDSGIAGETITAGMPLYKNPADNNRLYKVDANVSLAASRCCGVALGGAAAGQRVTYAKEDPQFTPGTPLVAGDIVIAGATVAGDINPVADLATGWFPVVLGVANSTSQMSLKIVAGGVAK